MVSSGSLLPMMGDGWRECRYLCAACGQRNVLSEQYVNFGPGDTPPRTMRLPCYGAMLDLHTGLEHVPVHLYVLAEPRRPAGDGQDVGGQARPEGAEG